MSEKRSPTGALLCGFLLLLLFCFPGAAAAGAGSGLSLFVSSVLPVVLPFFTVTTCLSLTGAADYISPLLKVVCRFFRLPENLGGTLLLSLISGSPNGARLLREYDLPPAVCLRFLTLSSCMSPLFCICVPGNFLGNPQLGLFLYLLQLFSAFLLGLFLRLFPAAKPVSLPRRAALPFVPAFTQSLTSACLSCLTVAGAMALFGALRSILSIMHLTDALQRVTGYLLPGESLSPLLSGFLEVSVGCREAAGAVLPVSLRVSLMAGFCAFGGLSMALQVLSFLPQLPVLPYLISRFLHGALTFALCRLLLMLSWLPIPVFSGNGAAVATPVLSVFAAALSFSFVLVFVLFFSCLRHKKQG